MTSNAIVWFRQDLRLYDNPAFSSVCHHHDHVIPLYILDETATFIGGAQRWWLHHSLASLDERLKKLGLNLVPGVLSSKKFKKTLVVPNTGSSGKKTSECFLKRHTLTGQSSVYLFLLEYYFKKAANLIF